MHARYTNTLLNWMNSKFPVHHISLYGLLSSLKLCFIRTTIAHDHVQPQQLPMVLVQAMRSYTVIIL